MIALARPTCGVCWESAVSEPSDSQTVAQVEPGLLARIGRLSPWRFVGVISMILIVAKLLQMPLWIWVFHHHQPSEPEASQPWEELGWAGTLLVVVVAMPWVETLLGQALWMVMTSPRSRPTMGYIIPATIWFCFLHGVGSGSGWLPDFGSLDWWLKLLPHAVSSFILACSFQHGWKHSWWRGIWMTGMVHSAGNLSACIILLFLSGNF
jgi:hypothetical protein